MKKRMSSEMQILTAFEILGFFRTNVREFCHFFVWFLGFPCIILVTIKELVTVNAYTVKSKATCESKNTFWRL